MKSFFLILLIVYTTSVSGQDLRFAGVRFQSKAEKKTQLTSLKLNKGNPVELKGDFSISFDLSFWTHRNFGNIFRVFNSDGKILLNVIYNQFRRDDTSFVEFYSSDIKGVEKAFPKNDLYENNWYNFKLYFDTNLKNISVFINDQHAGNLPADIQTINNLVFSFGIWDFNNINDRKIPGMNIRNIVISSENRTLYHWVLDPLINEGIYDSENNMPLELENGAWIRVGHYKWNHVATIPFNIKSGVFYDEESTSLLVDRKEDLVIIDLKTMEDTFIKYRNKKGFWWSNIFYNPNEKVIYTNGRGDDQVSVLNIQTGIWSEADTLRKPEAFGAMKFFDKFTNSLYLIGGYAKFRMENSVRKYNFESRKWEEVPMKQNDLEPVYGAAMTPLYQEGRHLIFGGKGNRTGRQEDGYKRLYDFHILDLKELTITDLGTSPDSILFTSLSSSMGFNREDSTIYILRRYAEPSEVKTTMEVITGSLNNLGLKIKGAPLIGRSNKDESPSYGKLFYSNLLKKIIVLVYNNSTENLNIYTLNTPLLDKEDFDKIVPVISEENQTAPLFILAVLFLAAGSFVLLKKTSSRKQEDTIPGESIQFNSFQQNRIKKELKVFGGFFLYNDEGEDISTRFSAKLKELFLLILSRSLQNQHNYGISTEELNTILWPDASPENVKSSRGVAMNKLRKILADTGIRIVFENKLWSLRLENEYRFDLLEYLEFRSEFRDEHELDDEKVVKITEILSSGEMLKGISYEWLDARKVSFNQEIINFLLKLGQRYTGKPPILLMIADAILIFDPVDENGFRMKIKALLAENKTSAAYSVYQLYAAEYLKLYNKDYPVTFTEISGI
jgi:DNA-binding SARP family transcriptional activator